MTIAPCHDEGHNAPAWLRLTSPLCGATMRTVDNDERDDEVFARSEARRTAIMEAAELRRQARVEASRLAAIARKETIARERVARHEYSLRMRAENAAANKKRRVVAAVRKSRAKPVGERSGYRISERMREEIERRRPAGMLTKIEAVVYMRNNYGRGSLSGLHKAIMEKRLVAIKIDRYYYMTTTAIDDYRKRSHVAHVRNGINLNRANAAKHRGAA